MFSCALGAKHRLMVRLLGQWMLAALAAALAFSTAQAGGLARVTIVSAEPVELRFEGLSLRDAAQRPLQREVTITFAGSIAPSDLRALAERLPDVIASVDVNAGAVTIRARRPADFKTRSEDGGFSLRIDELSRAGDLEEPVERALARAEALFTDGMVEEARNALAVLRQSRPDDPRVLAAAARAESLAGDPELAFAYYDRALRARPGDPALRQGRSVAAAALIARGIAPERLRAAPPVRQRIAGLRGAVGGEERSVFLAQSPSGDPAARAVALARTRLPSPQADDAVALALGAPRAPGTFAVAQSFTTPGGRAVTRVTQPIGAGLLLEAEARQDRRTGFAGFGKESSVSAGLRFRSDLGFARLDAGGRFSVLNTRREAGLFDPLGFAGPWPEAQVTSAAGVDLGLTAWLAEEVSAEALGGYRFAGAGRGAFAGAGVYWHMLPGMALSLDGRYDESEANAAQKPLARAGLSLTWRWR